jgi:hypothetical protein
MMQAQASRHNNRPKTIMMMKAHLSCVAARAQTLDTSGLGGTDGSEHFAKESKRAREQDNRCQQKENCDHLGLPSAYIACQTAAQILQASLRGRSKVAHARHAPARAVHNGSRKPCTKVRPIHGSRNAEAAWMTNGKLLGSCRWMTRLVLRTHTVNFTPIT